jgi:hypothetical protein
VARSISRAFLKLAFHVLTLVLFLALYLPVHLILDALFAPPGGWGEPGLVVSMVGIFVCVLIADRFTSFAFRVTRLTDERWSVFSHGPKRRSSRIARNKPV